MTGVVWKHPPTPPQTGKCRWRALLSLGCAQHPSSFVKSHLEPEIQDKAGMHPRMPGFCLPSAPKLIPYVADIKQSKTKPWLGLEP